MLCSYVEISNTATQFYMREIIRLSISFAVIAATHTQNHTFSTFKFSAIVTLARAR